MITTERSTKAEALTPATPATGEDHDGDRYRSTKAEALTPATQVI